MTAVRIASGEGAQETRTTETAAVTEVHSFRDYDRTVLEARRTFRASAEPQRREIEEVVELLFAFSRSIGKFEVEEGWSGSREEDILIALLGAFEPMMGMLYLSESGFYNAALGLKRNFAELMVQAIAISHSPDLHVKWKHDRSPFDDFHKIVRALEEAETPLPPNHARFVRQLAKYWNESSSLHSHMLGKKAVSDVLKGESFHLGVHIAIDEAEAKRLRTIRNMCLDMVVVLVSSFEYGAYTEARKEEFPEALDLIARWNKFAMAAQSAADPTM